MPTRTPFRCRSRRTTGHPAADGGGVDQPLLGVEAVPREIEAVGGPVHRGRTRCRRRRARRAEPFARLEPRPVTELETVAPGARAQHDVHRARIRRQGDRERAHDLYPVAGDYHDPVDGPRLARELVALVLTWSTDRLPASRRQVVRTVEAITRGREDAKAAAELRGIVCAPVTAPERDRGVFREREEASHGRRGAGVQREPLADDRLLVSGCTRRSGRPRTERSGEADQQAHDSQIDAQHDDLLRRRGATAP